MRSAMTWMITAAASVFLAGCDFDNRLSPAGPAAPVAQPTPAPNGNAAYLPKTAVRGDETKEPDTAVDSALQWAQKYSEASEKLVKLQQDNRTASDKVQLLETQVAKLQLELAQSASQLKDANSMLMEMRGELDKWKTSVLGFRQEMREAQQAQLTALGKVLKLLGGEVPAVAAPETPATQPAIPETAAAARGRSE
jgi:hypothetical protein